MKREIRATRIVVSTVGAFAGLLGIGHGFFEILQGNVATDGMLIEAIGPQTGLAGSEPALTIIPNLFGNGHPGHHRQSHSHNMGGCICLRRSMVA